MGVDVGSSDCKVMVIDQHGAIVRFARQTYPTQYPRPGWAEQQPEDWYQTACSTIRACLVDLDLREIAALSVDGPAHNVALMDGTGAIIHPTMHWSDLRSIPQSERLEARYRERIYTISYCRVNPAWTLSQLYWLKEEAPETWSKLRRILVTKDYVRYRFTGIYQTDVYDAIGTQLYDVAEDRWSDELCGLLEQDTDWLPTVAYATQISGELLPEAAQDTGLPIGLPIAVGSGDSVVEAFGIGAVRPGQAIVKLGTAANVNLVTAQPCPTPKSITYRHVVGEQWFTITATNSGASTMRWFRETFCRAESEQALAQGIDVYELIEKLSDGARPGSQGLIFHPYLNGERSPYWNPYLRGDFIGINGQHSMNHFARSVLEGVAFSLRDCFQVVESLGQPIETLYLIGGGAKSKLWRQILCDVLGRPLVKPCVEDAAFGAAMLAGVAVGVFPNWETAAQQCAQIETVLYPDPAAHELYNDYFEIYRAITHDMTRHYHTLAQIAGKHAGANHAHQDA
jgi:xylulokinase